MRQLKKNDIEKPRRICFIDEVRGFCVLCMVFFHGFFTVGYIFGLTSAQALFKFFTPVEPIFAGAFILISGICSCLSHSNLSRGLKLLLIALLFNFVTIFLLPDCAIYFGILNLLSVCMILFHFLSKPLEKVPFAVGFTVFTILFFLTFSIPKKQLGVAGILSYPLPQMLYESKYLFVLGFPHDSFISADYFPLIPWLFLFFAGGFLGRFAKAEKFPKFMYKSRIKIFSFLGKYALIVYVVHQPIIYGVTYLIYSFIK